MGWEGTYTGSDTPGPVVVPKSPVLGESGQAPASVHHVMTIPQLVERCSGTGEVGSQKLELIGHFFIAVEDPVSGESLLGEVVVVVVSLLKLSHRVQDQGQLVVASKHDHGAADVVLEAAGDREKAVLAFICTDSEGEGDNQQEDLPYREEPAFRQDPSSGHVVRGGDVTVHELDVDVTIKAGLGLDLDLGYGEMGRETNKRKGSGNRGFE